MYLLRFPEDILFFRIAILAATEVRKYQNQNTKQNQDKKIAKGAE